MDFVIIIAILVMSVVIHEVAHGYSALALGDPTAKYQGRLTLNPIPHLDPVGSFIVPMIGYLLGGFIIGWARPVPFNPYNLRSAKWGEAIVAFAGPLSNMAIALIFGVILRIGTANNLLNEQFISLASYAVLINIVLALFNLIPIPPLDGSKILFSIFPYKWQNFRYNLERFGLIFVLLFIFLFWGLLRPVIFSLFSFVTGINM